MLIRWITEQNKSSWIEGSGFSNIPGKKTTKKKLVRDYY